MPSNVNRPVQETQTTVTPPNRPTDKASGENAISPVQQARTSAIASVTASRNTGESLAIQEKRAFAQGYVETTEKLAPVLAETMKRANDEFMLAVTGAQPETVPEGESLTDAFLAELKLGLK